MTKKYTGDAILKGGLTIKAQKPIDDRMVVQHKSDLYTMDAAYAYAGMAVSCIDTGTLYVLQNVENIAEEAGWKETGGTIIQGGEGGTVDLSDYVTHQNLQDALDDIPTPDLTNLVTEQQLEETLSGYPTKGEVENALAAIPKADLSDYATKDYVNKAIEGAGSGEGLTETAKEALLDAAHEDAAAQVATEQVRAEQSLNNKFVVCTQAEYDSMLIHDSKTFYYIKK